MVSSRSYQNQGSSSPYLRRFDPLMYGLRVCLQVISANHDLQHSEACERTTPDITMMYNHCFRLYRTKVLRTPTLEFCTFGSLSPIPESGTTCRGIPRNLHSPSKRGK